MLGVGAVDEVGLSERRDLAYAFAWLLLKDLMRRSGAGEEGGLWDEGGVRCAGDQLWFKNMCLFLERYFHTAAVDAGGELFAALTSPDSFRQFLPRPFHTGSGRVPGGAGGCGKRDVHVGVDGLPSVVTWWGGRAATSVVLGGEGGFQDGSGMGVEVPAQVSSDGADCEREWGRGMLRVHVVVSVDRAGVARLRIAVGTSKASLASCEGTAARAARADAGETTAPLFGDRQEQGQGQGQGPGCGGRADGAGDMDIGAQRVEFFNSLSSDISDPDVSFPPPAPYSIPEPDAGRIACTNPHDGGGAPAEPLMRRLGSTMVGVWGQTLGVESDHEDDEDDEDKRERSKVLQLQERLRMTQPLICGQADQGGRGADGGAGAAGRRLRQLDLEGRRTLLRVMVFAMCAEHERLDARIAVALRGLCDLLCLARVELVEWEDALLAAAPTIAALSTEYVAGQAEGGMVQGGMSRGGWRVGAAAVSTGAVLVASEGLSLPTSVFGVVGALSAGAATVASASGAVSEGV